MNELLEKMISQLPKSPTELDKENIKKIYSYIPVPTDYKILWADISSFGGFPAGVVLTNKALIVKSSRKEVKKSTDKEKQNDRIKGTYQIVPWEYYSPEHYEITAITDSKGNKKYVLKTGNTELAQFSSKALYNMLNSYKKRVVEHSEAAETTFSAINSINVEGVMFNAAYGADQTKTGHGIYAEEAGALLDKLSGEQSTVVGRDNAKNGPDKIVDTSPVQCKYCRNANASINACFKSDSTTGTKVFRYYDLSGNPMKVEVPSDQYAQAIEQMKNKIDNGQVPGVTDSNEAYSIVRKGKLTYNQALNLAKAGTVESITFDTVTGAVNCLSALGISSVVAYARTFWITKDHKKAAKSALYTGLHVYGMSFAGGVLASQISRTGLASSLSPITTEISKAINPKLAQEIVNAFRALAGKKAIYGIAAQKSFVKFLSSTAITQGVMLFVFSVPDTYKAMARKISGAQYLKNMTSLFASFTGSIVVSTATGAVLGKTVGEKVNKKVGAAIGLASGLVGGALFGTAARWLGNLLHEDDAIITTRLFNAILINLFIDNMLSDSEQEDLIKLLNADEKQLRKLQQSLVTSKAQEKDIIEYLAPKIKTITDKRKRAGRIEERSMISEITAIVLEGDIEYGV